MKPVYQITEEEREEAINIKAMLALAFDGKSFSGGSGIPEAIVECCRYLDTLANLPVIPQNAEGGEYYWKPPYAAEGDPLVRISAPTDNRDTVGMGLIQDAIERIDFSLSQLNLSDNRREPFLRMSTALEEIRSILTPPAADSKGEAVHLGRCEGCGQLLQPNEIEVYGSGFCHVVVVADSHGDPTQEPCGPVHRYTDLDALPAAPKETADE
jgi:hypothetical protein